MEDIQVCAQLRYFLSIYGVTASTNRPLAKGFSYFINLVTCVYGLYGVYWNVTSNRKMYDLAMWRGISMELSPISVQVILNLLSSNICRIVYSMTRLVSVKDVSRIKRYIVTAVAFYFLSAISNLLIGAYAYETFTCYISNYRLNTTVPIEWYDWVLFSPSVVYDFFIRREWILFTSSLYLIILKMWSMADTRLAEYVTKTRTISRKEAIYFIKAKQHLNGLKEEFQSKLGILPLLNFFSIFFESAGLIVSMTHKNPEYHRIWFYCVKVFLTFFLVIAVDSEQRKEKKRIGMVVIKSWEQLGDKDFKVGLRLRDTFSQFTPLTAIFFEIDVTLVLSFVGTLVSFTVMLLQLQSS
ncbi:hypothetical protein HDE_06929 [Halotydeus destructor]|nr:hypothetical protein HDE_06929 [Halotydeus destructor]